MLSWQIHTGFSTLSSSYIYTTTTTNNLNKKQLTSVDAAGGGARIIRRRKSSNYSINCTLRFDQKSPSLVDFELPATTTKERQNDVEKKWKKKEVVDDDDEKEEEDISGIQVSRVGYIPVSKTDLLDAIVRTIFNSSHYHSHQQQEEEEEEEENEQSNEEEEEVDQFLLLCSCLDSVLHAEHKSILEQMRLDYHQSNMPDNEGGGTDEEESESESESDSSEIRNTEPPDSPIMPFTDYGFDFRKLLLGSSSSKYKNVKSYSSKSRVALATRFQRAFMQLLSNAQFEELSARDLMLTSALNTDYLLTLPVNVDWKRASESNAIIFRRGYAIERQKGLLIVEKLDYIQSKILQRIFFLISKPLGKVGIWITEALKNAFQTQEAQVWTEKMKLWITELSLIQQSPSYDVENSDNMLGVDQLPDRDLPMWLAAQRAVPRYEGLLSSVGPRGRLLRKLFTWTGLITPKPEAPSDIYNDSTVSEAYLRPIRLSRMSLSDIWRPASRKYCGNDFWMMLKTSVSILFSRSSLQEPAFQELILLYTKDIDEGETKDKVEVPLLQLKIYDRIPIPDLPVIFPHKKLSFRIIDTVRLDVASILGLLAYFINYKFVDNFSSLSAVLLDTVAVSALIIYVSRVALGYKQTWDRYQLLVNRTLYEKTLASGFGSVHFLLDASEQQQYKEAILAYAILLKSENDQVHCRRSVGDKCERFIYDVLKVKVKMPIDKAMDTLVRLGLVAETTTGERIRLQALPCSKAYEAIKRRWSGLLNQF